MGSFTAWPVMETKVKERVGDEVALMAALYLSESSDDGGPSWRRIEGLKLVTPSSCNSWLKL